MKPVLYLVVPGSHLSHSDSKSDAFLYKVSMLKSIGARGLPKTCPDVPSKFHVSNHRLWSRVSVAQGLGMTAR